MDTPVMLSNVQLADLFDEMAKAKRSEQLRSYDIDPIDSAVLAGQESTFASLAEALRAMTAPKADGNEIAEMLRNRARRITRAAGDDGNSLTRAARKVVAEVLEEVAADLSPAQHEGSFW